MLAIIYRYYIFLYKNNNKKYLSNKNNTNFKLLYVSAKSRNKKRNIRIKKKQWVKDYNDILKKENVDIVIELIGGAEGAAKKLVFGALNKKKHVVIIHRVKKSSENFKSILNPIIIKQYGRSKIIFGKF